MDHHPQSVVGTPPRNPTGPPSHTRFKKGRSGNPKGRPKGRRNLSTVLEAVLREKVSVTDSHGTRKMTRAEAISKLIISRAIKGDPSTTDAVLMLGGKLAYFNEPSEKESKYGMLIVPGVCKNQEEWERLYGAMARGEHRRKNTQKLMITIEDADAAFKSGKVDEALACYRRHLADRKKRLAAQPDAPECKRDLLRLCDRFYLVADRFLWDGKFPKALDTIEETIPLIRTELSLGPAYLIWAHLTQAHALMFTGDADRARELYLRYCGQKIYQGKGMRKRTWEAVVLRQFDELQARDHWHPMMKEIEQRFAEGPSYMDLPAGDSAKTDVPSQLDGDLAEPRSGGSRAQFSTDQSESEVTPEVATPTGECHGGRTAILFEENEPRPEPFYDADGNALYSRTYPLSRGLGRGGARYRRLVAG